MFLTSASPVTTICSPQYLLPSPTVIRQKRFFLFKKNAHDFLSAFTTPSAILVEQHLRQSDQPLTAKLVVQKVEARRKVKKTGAKRGGQRRARRLDDGFRFWRFFSPKTTFISISTVKSLEISHQL